jgi:hypothetical protein
MIRCKSFKCFWRFSWQYWQCFVCNTSLLNTNSLLNWLIFVIGGGRYPKEAYSLSNCTWYRENACCDRTEVASVFREMPALLTSDKGCYNRMNYLMCYFCSPEQKLWYNQTLSICRSYCEEIFSYCGSAKYNGHSLASKYKDGVTFCEALAFNVVAKNLENHHCFQFAPHLFGHGNRNGLCQWLLVVVFITSVYISWAN